MSSLKTKVLSAYPDAIMVEDTHNYGDYGAALPFVLIRTPVGNVEKIENGKMLIDWYKMYPRTIIKPLSTFCKTEEECYKDAWNRIMNKMSVELSK